ncbi:MAG: methionine biosynthesis protein MetW [Chloroflexi bacterium]|nr:MAG: methionine biosynthesis protein MetW [Chloroflexota bacterium]
MENNSTISNLRPDLQAIAELIRPGEKVLDLGCGDGELLQYLVANYQVTGRGIELSEDGVLSCVKRGLSVRQGNLDEGLGDYPDLSFDTVILSQTLPYLDDIELIFNEMLRVGRRAIVSFANWGYWRCRLSFLLTGRVPVPPGLPQPWFDSPRARPLTVRDVGEFCQQHGIRITRQIYLQGAKRIPVRRDKNLRATVAIFELKR